MNNEETTLDPQYTAKPQAKTSAGVNPAKPEKKKSSDRGENATYAAVGVAGGAVAGAAIGVAATASGQTFAANAQPANAEGAEEARADSKTATATDDSATTGGEATASPQATPAPATARPEDSPAPEEAIIATADGVRVAQVNDDQSFSQAFADARAQVGPGGVFEWRGNVYGTYYKDEWDQMSAEDKSAYQASIDYEAVQTNRTEPQQDHADQNARQELPQEEVVATPVAGGDEVADSEIHVIGIERNVDAGDGQMVDLAQLEYEGQIYVALDADQDGTIDAIATDVNRDGRIDQNEIIDVQGEGYTMPDATPGDAYYAQADSQPDYMNDANPVF